MSGAEAQQLLEANNTLVTKLTELVSTLQTSATPAPATTSSSISTTKSIIQHPAAFKSGAADSHRYLQYFTLWALTQGAPLNVNKEAEEKLWISMFLSGLKGEAATWASKYIKVSLSGRYSVLHKNVQVRKTIPHSLVVCEHPETVVP
jgi:hypothetical protein